VRHHPPALSQHLPRAARVAHAQLLEDGVAQPQVDVPPPQPLVGGGGHVGERALVDVARVAHVERRLRLLELEVVEPRVVHVGVLAHLLLVLEALLGADDVVDALAVAVLLLELHVLLVELLRLRARQRVEAELVDDARAVALLGTLLELAEGEEELLRVVALLELLERALEDLARRLRLALLLLELGPLAPRLRVVVALHVALEDLACARGLVDAHLEADVRGPRVVVGLPVHPAVEDDARAREVAHHLLHVHVLEPELLDARHQRDGAVPHVARRVDVPVAHLHLGVLQPERRVAVVDV